ncbi:hypothetical protein R1X32_08975 (plasmid) [Rhodococcus opacus]|uniref:hypothetical protein n=1 Tax=Rhodococcus opacus TaxID=37919 RepID=UPI00030EDBF4|nr:hypothetical protein [Rhodococcus opacus]MDV6248035.1 hypothetical protein [Rhodococcus opacus]WKN59903.1 hypothetical protein HJ581_0039320 [Rhodococcus opacus]
MALGLTRRTRAHPVDLENLAYAAHEFREALIPLHGITPDRCDAAATELLDRAHHAEERFFAAVAGLPRRERTLAGHWDNAAVMRYRYGLEIFARAEDLGADMLAQLATTGGRRCPRSPNCVTPVPMPAPLTTINGPRCSGQAPAGPPDGVAPPPPTRPPTTIGPPNGPALSIKLNSGGGSAAI